MKENSIAKKLDLLLIRKQLFGFEDEYTANIKDLRIPNSIGNIHIISLRKQAYCDQQLTMDVFALEVKSIRHKFIRVTLKLSPPN